MGILTMGSFQRYETNPEPPQNNHPEPPQNNHPEQSQNMFGVVWAF